MAFIKKLRKAGKRRTSWLLQFSKSGIYIIAKHSEA